MAPASTGFGVNLTLTIVGAPVSSFTVRVTVVDLPALSVATIVIVLVPSASVNVLLKDPSEATVTLSAEPELRLMVSVTGLEVASFVLPVTVHVLLFVTYPSTGAVIFSVGGTVSILNVTLFCVAALPS